MFGFEKPTEKAVGPPGPRPTPKPRSAFQLDQESPKPLPDEKGNTPGPGPWTHPESDTPQWFQGWELFSGEIRRTVRYAGTDFVVRVTDFCGTFTGAFAVSMQVQQAIEADIHVLTIEALRDGDVQFRISSHWDSPETITISPKPRRLNDLIGD